jgi:hypothetical protein
VIDNRVVIIESDSAYILSNLLAKAFDRYTERGFDWLHEELREQLG